MVEIKVVICVDIYGRVKVNFNLIGVELRDVHAEYDGKYSHLYEIKEKYDKETKTTKLDNMIDEMKEMKLDVTGLELIKKDLGTPANRDDINKLNAEDILMEIMDLLVEKANDVIKQDVYKDLSEQMKDMHDTGQCGQGRTNRLMQIYFYLK